MIKNQKFIEKIFFNKNISKPNVLVLAYIFLLFSSLFIARRSNAEYLVYQYYVKSPMSEKTQIIIHTLSPNDIKKYYGNSFDQYFLVNSWKCYGDTSGHKPPCDLNDFYQKVSPPENSL